VLPPIQTPKKNAFSSKKFLENVDHKNLVALKIFKNTHNSKVKHEYKISKLASSGFKNIVKPKKLKINAKDVQVGTDSYETELSYIAYEYLQGESLLQKLMDESNPLKELESLEIFKSILFSLKHLHEDVGMAHQDLKPENFVFTKTGEIKMIDLAFATPVD